MQTPIDLIPKFMLCDHYHQLLEDLAADLEGVVNYLPLPYLTLPLPEFVHPCVHMRIYMHREALALAGFWAHQLTLSSR